MKNYETIPPDIHVTVPIHRTYSSFLVILPSHPSYSPFLFTVTLFIHPSDSLFHVTLDLGFASVAGDV